MTIEPRNRSVNGPLPGSSLPFLPIPGWWLSKPRPRRRSRTLRFDALENRVVLATAVWQAQGPGVTQNGQAEGIPSQNNPVVGAVHTVIAHPTDADIMWIGAVNGGIWRTNNATATTPVWTPQTDQQPGMSMGALHLDTTDLTYNTLVAGIGRFSSLASDGGARVGLLRTTDGGANWTQITGGGLLLGKNISGVAAWGSTIVVSVNIADSFTFGNIGIFRSTDGGASFTQISTGNGAATGLPGGVAYDLVTDPSDSNVLYTSIHFADLVLGLNGVYKSTNRGANWTKVSNSAMDALLNIGTTNNLEMAVGSSNNVYAAIVNQGQLAGLFRSGNGGTTWTQLDTPQTNENGTFIGLQPRQKGPGPGSAPEAVAGSQGSTHQSIAADPTNPNVVYLGGDRQPSRTSGGVEIGTFPNSLGAQNYSGRLFRVDASLAAGSQVSSLTHQIGVATTLNSAPHADSRDMTFDVLGRLIEVNDGGVYRRGNPSGIGDWIGLMGQSLQVTEFHSLGYDPVSNVIIGGTQDTGTPYQTAPGSMVFTEIMQGDGGVVQVDAQTLSGSNQSIRYMSFQNFQQFRREVRNASGGLVSASNPGLIVAGSGGLTLRSFDNTVQFYQPYELNAIDPSRAVIGTRDLYETTDQFANLTRIVDNTSSSISAMAYGGNGNADVIYYGNANGQLFVRTTAGGAFVQRTALVGGSQTIRDIALDSRDWQTAFVVDTNQVFMTTDSGATFADVTGNLLALSGGAAPRTITFLVGAGLGGIVVGTDRGAFFSTSTAYNSWQQYGAGLPNVPVSDLRYNATDDVLTAGTLGRGAWMVSSASSTLATPAITIVQSSGTTDVTEGGATDSFTVVLAAQPATNVVISVTSGNTLQTTGSPTSLTFTSANWNVPQTVTVTAVNDSLLDGTVNVPFTLAVVDASSDDAYDNVADQTVSVVTRDNDIADLVVAESGGTTDVTEGGATDSFVVFLTAQPTSNVVVSVTSGNTSQATAGVAILTFTPANWDTAQFVTATAVNDDLVDGTVNVTFTLAVVDASSDNSFDNVADRTVTVITRDNDVAGLLVVESSGTTDVSEGGATDSFTVVLTAQPTTDVLVSVTSGNTLQATGSPTSLTFTSANWNTPQTVTVTAVNDSLVDGTVNVPFTVAVVDASSDNAFDPVADQVVTVITRDNDVAGLLVVESSGTTDTTEGGATDSFTVVLTAQPLSDVVVSVTSGNSLQATGSPTSLTFTSVNWNIAQTVTVTAVDDTVVDGTVNVAFTVAVVDASSDNAFDPVADQVVTVITRDNEVAGFLVVESGGTTDVTEGGATDSFTVVLTAQPLSDVVVSVTSGNSLQATGSPTSLTFSSANWNTPQTVTVTAVDDGLVDGTVNVAFTVAVVDASSNDLYDSVADQVVTVITRDDDVTGLLVVESGGTTDVTEGGATDSFTVALSVQPTTDVVVSVTSGDTLHATGSPTSLTFTSANWNVPQTVTVTAVDDSMADGTVNVPFMVAVVDASSDDLYDSVADVTVTVIKRDNEVASLLVVESGGTTDVTEGGATDSFTVVLTSQPATDVVVSVTSGNTLQTTGSPTSLTFTSANWNIAQTVTVTAVDDSTVDGTVNVPFTVAVVDASSDNDYDSVADVIVTVITRDRPNRTPTALGLSNTTFAEDVATGNGVGNFTTTDPDAGNSFTYTLETGTGSADNGLFQIVGDELRTNAAFDFETRSSYSILVRTTDQGGLFFEQQFTITVTDVNEQPTVLALSNATIAENVVLGTAIGNFTTTDPDAANTFTYTLETGTGSTDNGSFQIVGDELRTNAALDFETQSTFTIRVRTTDQDGLFFEQQFTITVTNVNEQPTALALSNSTVAEDVATGTGIGNFTTTDPDASNTFTYTLVTGTGSTDNGSFQIVGDELQTNTALDFETQPTYTIRVRTTDQDGLFFEQQFTITVTNVNEQPTALALSNATVAENVATGTAIGNFTTTDPDAANTFTYTLVTGTGSTDNGSFQIVGAELRTNAALDFETQPSYTIRVRTADQGGLFFEQQFMITVTNVNEQPTALALSNATVAENVATGTAIGNFTTTDPDAANTFTYTLVTGTGSTDNGSFQIVGAELRTNAALDFETQPTYTIRVRTTDQGGLFFEQQFTITVTDVNEAPTVLALSNASIAENVVLGTAIGNFTSTDPDAANTFTYTLVTGTGSTDNGSFQIVGDELRTNAALDFETQSTYTIRVRTTDQGGRWFEQQFTITVTNVNETPTALALSTTNVSESTSPGATIGTFTTTDPDAANTFIYTLVAGAGSADNVSFQIVGNELRSDTVFDFETRQSYTIRVRTTDQGGRWFEQQFTITVTNVNEQPAVLVLSGTSVAENVALGTLIGSFSTTDPDAANTFTYALVAGAGSTNNASFQIVGNQLLTNAAVDFETRSWFTIRVRTTDQGGHSLERTFAMTVSDINETPTALHLTNTIILENADAGTAIGAFITTDPDVANTFTYALVPGAGSADNASFTIAGNQLRSNAVFNFEARPTYSIRVRTTDQNNLSFESAFTITVTNVSEIPTGLALSASTLAEGIAAGTPIGIFTTTDPDLGGTFTYSLVAEIGSTDNTAFSIVGNQLRSAVVFNFEAKPTYSIRIRTTDQSNLSIERSFTISVTNVNEAPVLNNAGDVFTVLGVGSRQSAEMRQGTLVSEILARGAGGNPISDPDNGALRGIALTNIDRALGTFQYTLVTNSPSESDWTFVEQIGAISDASALLLPANARLRFSTPRVPHHDAPGVFLALESKLDVGLTFRAWDQTTGVAGGRGDASVNGGATAFSTSTETARVYFEARLFRHFNRTAELNIYTLEAEFNALAAFNDPAFEDRSTDAWTGFTVLLSPVPELATTALYRMYYGVQFNTNGTEIDMGYRYLTTNLLEAQALENSGPADKRPQRAGAYFREQGVNAGTGVLGYIYTTQQPGTQQMRQMYRADIVQKPTRPAGTAEGGTPTSFTPQESGDHVYTTNTAFESTKTGTWRVESAPGFVRPLGGQGIIAPATAAGTALAGTSAEPVVRSGTTAVATTTDLVDAFITPRQILATAGVIVIGPLASTATIPLGLIAIPAAPVSVPATVVTLEADDRTPSSSLASTEDSALGELDALFTTLGSNAFDLGVC